MLHLHFVSLTLAQTLNLPLRNFGTLTQRLKTQNTQRLHLRSQSLSVINSLAHPI
jgi:hypothetical protein